MTVEIVETLPIADGDPSKTYVREIATVSHKNVHFSWLDVWRLIRGRTLELRAIQRWHPIGESSAEARLTFR